MKDRVTMADPASLPTDLADETTETTAEIDPARPADTEAISPGAATASDGGPVNDDLMGELARAMHTAATSQYERMNADLERRRAEQVEAIAARAATETENLKAGVDQDIAAIDAWAKAETEKVKQERLRRIDARREQLASQLERQDTIRQREIFAIEVAIDAHRGEIDQFFGRMERESDPTAIARVASSLPPFPVLDEIADEARRGALAEFELLEREAGRDAAPERTVTASTASNDTASSTSVIPDEVAPEGTVSASRLMAVMDPGATSGGNPNDTPPWEPPYAVSVAAGSGSSEAAAEPEPHGRVGSTLLRTVRAIRPMAGSDKDDTAR
jgi:hypothetical protein